MRWWMLTTHTMVIIPWSHISLLHPFNLHSVGCHLCLNKACRVGGQILICARSPLGGWPSPPLYDDIILYKFILLQRMGVIGQPSPPRREPLLRTGLSLISVFIVCFVFYDPRLPVHPSLSPVPPNRKSVLYVCESAFIDKFICVLF